MKPVIKVDIVSDVVCPWCFIGKRRIEKAMNELSSEYYFTVSYLPFQLNPSVPKEGLDQKEYLIKKFGGEARYHQLTNHVTGIAAQEGLQFDFSKQQVSPNTFDAHRLLWFAKNKERQPALKELLMKAYFEEGVDLTKKENLIQLAVKANLDEPAVSEFLSSAEGYKEVKDLELLNHQRGISGVPFYIINDKYGVSGAQPTDVFIQTFREIGNEISTSSAESCDIENPVC